MAAIAWADVIARFPSDATLAALPVPAQTEILALVNGTLSPTFFGGEASVKYKAARVYYAAHLALAGGMAGNVAAGPVTSESEGGVSRSYAVASSQADGSNSNTSYGRMFDALVRSSPYRIGGTS